MYTLAFSFFERFKIIETNLQLETRVFYLDEQIRIFRLVTNKQNIHSMRWSHRLQLGPRVNRWQS